MYSRTSLRSGVALGALVAVALCGAAEAKTTKHHKTAAAPAPAAEDINSQRIDGLTAEVEALKARLDEESAARAKAETAAAAAADDAHAVRTQLAEQIQTIPGAVKSAVAANKPKPADTVVSGRVYADISNIHQTAAGTGASPAPVALNGTGLDIKRAYLGIDHKFNDTYSANLTIDFNAVVNGNGNNTNGANTVSTKCTATATAITQPLPASPTSITVPAESISCTSTGSAAAVYTKKAYLQAKYDDALILRVGAADMPWIPFVEDAYGYRFVEKTLTDTYSYANSADWGVFALGKFYGGLINYSVAAVDGGGYKNPARSKGLDFEGRVNVNYMGFTVAAGGYTGKLSKDVNAVTPPTFHTATREDVLVSYSNKMFRIGGEYMHAQNWKDVTKTTAEKADGYSVFGNYNFTDQISVFGRYDYLKPSASITPVSAANTISGSERADYYNLGVNYEPSKTVDLALVYKHDHLHGLGTASLGDANTTLVVPGVSSLSSNSNYDEVGLFTQFRF